MINPQFQYQDTIRIIQLLTQLELETIDYDRFLEILAQQLIIPDFNNIILLDIILNKIDDQEKLVPILKNTLSSLDLKKNKSLSYAVELTKFCLKLRPNHPILLDQLFWLSIQIPDYQGVIFPANQYLQEINSLPLKTFGYYKLFIAILVNGLWLKMPEQPSAYKASLFELVKSGQVLSDPTLYEYLPNLPSSLKYLEDNPHDYRFLQNTYSQYFYQQLQSLPQDISPPVQSFACIPKPILKIGYIAHTFRRHSVGFLSRWLIHYHNPQQFKIYVYLVDQEEDDITQLWFTNKAHKLTNFSKDYEMIAQKIRDDNIDILVDLDSLTRTLTCKVLALKPAPIQVTWLGLDASGLPTIDYFIADPYVLPEDAQADYRETIWRLPQTYLAVDEFEVGSPTITRESLEISNDALVYISVQAAEKRHPDTIHLQLQILQAVPNSFLLLKGRGNQMAIKELFLTIADEYQISSKRIRFLENVNSEENHRANLAIADIVLDTYPYNGATTTLEALWMNLPVVTKVGKQFSARNGYTFLKNLGIVEGIAWNDEDYIRWGILLGKDKDLRKSVIDKLQQAKHTSVLWNAKEFTEAIENAYQKMWASHVNSITCY